MNLIEMTDLDLESKTAANACLEFTEDEKRLVWQFTNEKHFT